jgi:hypothetical protein
MTVSIPDALLITSLHRSGVISADRAKAMAREMDRPEVSPDAADAERIAAAEAKRARKRAKRLALS